MRGQPIKITEAEVLNVFLIPRTTEEAHELFPDICKRTLFKRIHELKIQGKLRETFNGMDMRRIKYITEGQ